MSEAPLRQETTEDQLWKSLRGDPRGHVALYIGSSDPIGILEGMVPRGQPVTSVTGGCEYPLALLRNEPASLHLCDVSALATAAAEVKLRCLRVLDRGDYAKVWSRGAATPLTRTPAFDRHVAPHVSRVAGAAACALSDADTMRRLGDNIAKRSKFAMPDPPDDSYERLQGIARETVITLGCDNMLDLPAPIGEPHTFYISNAGIVHDQTRGYAARLAQIGWSRVLFTTSEYAEDHFGSKVYGWVDGKWAKRPDREYWNTVEHFYGCSYNVLGHEYGTDFPLLVECTPTDD